jgi:hypothetical protein
LTGRTFSIDKQMPENSEHQPSAVMIQSFCIQLVLHTNLL